MRPASCESNASLNLVAPALVSPRVNSGFVCAGSHAVGERSSAQGCVRCLPDRDLTALQVLLLLCKILCRIQNKKLALSSGLCQILSTLLHGGQTHVVCTTEK